MKITRKDFEYNKFTLHDKFTWILLTTLISLVLFVLWYAIEFLIIKIVFTVLLIVIIPFILLDVYKNEAAFKNSTKFIVEDVFINAYVKKCLGTKGRYRPYIRRDYTVKFSRNGEYKIEDYREKIIPDEPNTDDLIIFSSKPGDKFYLIILENNNQKIIYNAFNSNYYTIEKDDFTLIDGKYFLKNANYDIQGENDGK